MRYVILKSQQKIIKSDVYNVAKVRYDEKKIGT